MLLSGSPVSGQEPLEDGSLTEEVEVSIVNLDVYVTDKKGRPITGLTREDFRILEDRQEVEISNFLAVENTPSGEMSADGALVEPLHLVIYLDNALMLPSERQRVLTDVREFLTRKFPRETRFMLATHGSSLDVVVPYTTEAERVTLALENLEKDATGITTRTDRNRAEFAIESVYDACDTAPNCAPCEDVWEEMVQAARGYAIDVDQRTSSATNTLFRFIASLGGLPGRKALLYLSSGMEQRPGEDMFYSLTTMKRCPERASDINAYLGEFDQTSRLYTLAAHANANRVTFYTLDTAGIRESDDGQQSAVATSNLRGPLYLLGSETGGESIFNSARPLSQLEGMAQDLTNYYSIAYNPVNRREQERRPDVMVQSHLIDVELPGNKKAQIRYRRSMRPKTLKERLAERLMATLILGAEDNPLEAKIEIDQPTLIAEKRHKVPVRVVIPGNRLLRIAQDTEVDSRVRIFMVARDDQNRGTEVREKVFRLGDDLGALAGGGALSYVINLELDPGDYQIAIGIRDEIARTASYLRQPVSIAKP
jgi:VWFA-related protein